MWVIGTPQTHQTPQTPQTPQTIQIHQTIQTKVMLKHTLLSALVLSFQLLFAQSSPPADLHQGFDALLEKYVNNEGKVNYTGLKADKKALNAYCKLLTDNPVQDVWSREQKMAYWINAYNAYTLKLIVDNYPLKSIMNLDGGKTWDVRRIKLGDKKYSLNNIENDILRPQFKDARIHFVINCAAKGCPPLWNHAITAENLEAVLTARTKDFVNNPIYNQINTNDVKVSKIFQWYAADFGDLKNFLNQNSKTWVKRSASVVFMEYDWGLNE